MDTTSTRAIHLPELISKAKTERGFVWLGLAEPTQEEFDKVAGDFRFHIHLQLRMRSTPNSAQSLEDYPDLQFCVLRTAFYDEAESEVSTGEILASSANTA
jgi:magnesium transporter